MVKRAILVGCNYPNTQSALSGCWNDVHRMYDLLTTVYRFSPGDIVKMTDNLSPSDANYPNRVNVMRELNRTVTSMASGDVVVFHYSGHGTTERDRYSTSTAYTGIDDAIIPTDCITSQGYHLENEIVDTQLWTLVNGTPAESMFFAVIDACHSGSELNLPWQMRLNGRGSKEFTLGKVEKNPETQGTVICLAGCKDDQTSLDGTDDHRQPSGALTFAFCSYILRNATNKQVSYGDMLFNVRKEIQDQYAGTPNLQEPQLCFGRQIDSQQPFTLNSAVNTKDIDMQRVYQLIDEITPKNFNHRTASNDTLHSALLKKAQAEDILTIRQQMVKSIKMK